MSTLNTRNELASGCRHARKFLLSGVLAEGRRCEEGIKKCGNIIYLLSYFVVSCFDRKKMVVTEIKKEWPVNEEISSFRPHHVDQVVELNEFVTFK